MTENKDLSAALIIIGNEILSGKTQDTNSAWIAKRLVAKGIPLCEIRIIPDIAETIIQTVNDMRSRFTYVFTTGGIGPTHDDITTASIAQAFDVPALLNEEALTRLTQYYGTDDLNDGRRKMAIIPKGAALIDNPVSVAPGFKMENVYTMAGIPKIMQSMFLNIEPHLETAAAILSKTITCHTGESFIAPFLSEAQNAYPDIEIGSYPKFEEGRPLVSIVISGRDETRLNALYDLLKQHLTDTDTKITAEE